MILSRRVARFTGRQFGFGAVVSSVWAVEERIAAGTRYRLGRVSRLTLMATDSGRVIDAKDPAERPIHTRTSLTILPKESPYRDYVLPGSDWHVWYLMFTGAWAQQMARECRLCRGKRSTTIDPAPRPARQHLRDAVIAALDQPRDWTWSFLSNLAAVLGAISSLPPTSIDGAGRNGLVERMRRLIESDPRRAWPIREIAEALNAAPSTISHSFRAVTGAPPASWVRRCRIEASHQLLTRGLSVSETSRRMGFANPYHFSRLFKSITGAAPSSVRSSQAVRTLR